MYKAPVGPQSGRTPRQRAEEIGTDPAGFKEGPAYDVTGGHPITKQQPSQTYAERPMKPGSPAAKPVQPEAPFKIG